MPAKRDYLDELGKQLRALNPGTQEEILTEVRDHLEDRTEGLQTTGSDGEAGMKNAVAGFGPVGELGSALRDVHEPSSWSEAVLGAMPLIALSLAMTLYVAPWLRSVWVDHVLAVMAYAALLFTFGRGWIKGFPRSSYAGAGLLSVLLLRSLLYVTHKGWIPKHLFFWVSLLAAVVFLWIRTGSLRPLMLSALNAWRDWTRVSFAVYGAMAGLIFVSFDEVNWYHQAPFFLSSVLVLALGAASYCLSTTTRHRAYTLLGGMTLSWAVATTGIVTYWTGRLEPWMSTAGNWYEHTRGMAIMWLILLAFMFSPALIAAIRPRAETILRGR